MKSCNNNRGAVVIFVTAFLALMVLFIGVAVDIGWMAYVRSQGQAAVDAAALSGAAGLPAYNKTMVSSLVMDRVSSLNGSNLIMNQPAEITDGDIQFCSGNADNCSPTTWPAEGVRVSKSIPTPLFFANLLNGGNPATVNVSAVAWLGAPAGAKPDLPVALMDCEVGFPGTCDAPKTLDGFNQTDSPSDDSAFTSFFAPSASAKVFKDMIENPQANIPYVKVGDPIELNNGQVNSALKEIEKAYEKNKNASGQWCVLLPVISCGDLSSGNPVQKAKVVGFATMCITGVDSTGSPKSIQASLDCDVTPPAPIPSTDEGGTFGTYATVPILVR